MCIRDRSYVDEQVGKIVKTLKETGMWDNTVLVFSSDHGDMIGERGLWFKKTLFDPAVRVPMIIRIPDRSAQRIKAPVSLIDLLPTFTELAGIPPQELVTKIEGRSLLPLLDKDDPERITYCEHLDGAVTAPRVMLRKGSWKLVFSEAYPAQLYDLSTDPNELNNLADAHAHEAKLNELLAEVRKTWDLDSLREDVIRNQKMRTMVYRALNKGKEQEWDVEPNAPALMKFVRGNDMFPELERVRYLPYSD